MAMVVRANKESPGIGGHISSYSSAATLYEVGFNHFFRGPEHKSGGDLIFFQGHSIPGIYARSFLEGRFSKRLLSLDANLPPGRIIIIPTPVAYARILAIRHSFNGAWSINGNIPSTIYELSY